MVLIYCYHEGCKENVHTRLGGVTADRYDTNSGKINTILTTICTKMLFSMMPYAEDTFIKVPIINQHPALLRSQQLGLALKKRKHKCCNAVIQDFKGRASISTV